MIKAITFDFWSTLYTNKTEDYAKRIVELKRLMEQASGETFALESFKEAIKTTRATWNKVWQEEHRTLNAWEWVAVLAEQLGVTLLADGHKRVETYLEDSILDSWPIVVDEAKSVLAELSSRYRLAIISDTALTPGRVLRQILRQDELASYFTHFTFSDELGHSKPHPNAFLSTLKALDVAPHEAVHVGDLLRTDIAGAQQLGMRAVQYVGVNRDASLDIEPDAVINNHAELEPLLASWNNRHYTD